VVAFEERSKKPRRNVGSIEFPKIIRVRIEVHRRFEYRRGRPAARRLHRRGDHACVVRLASADDGLGN
jgi:hypothetical protein